MNRTINQIHGQFENKNTPRCICNDVTKGQHKRKRYRILEEKNKKKKNQQTFQNKNRKKQKKTKQTREEMNPELN